MLSVPADVLKGLDEWRQRKQKFRELRYLRAFVAAKAERKKTREIRILEKG